LSDNTVADSWGEPAPLWLSRPDRAGQVGRKAVGRLSLGRRSVALDSARIDGRIGYWVWKPVVYFKRFVGV